MGKSSISIMLFVFVIGAQCAPQAMAQDANETIGIWCSNALFMAQGETEYEFTANGSGLSVEIQNLTLKTHYGDIVFNDPIAGNTSMKNSKGYLTSAEEIDYFLITGAHGVVDGKTVDLTKIIHVLRMPSYTVGTSIEQINRFMETIDFLDLDKYLVNGLIFYKAKSAVTLAATTHDLLTTALGVLADSNLDSTIYNNDMFFYSEEDGVFLVLISNGATQGFKIIQLAAYDPTETGKVIFSFTCEMMVDDLHGAICQSPEIIDNGKKITYEQAIKSNPIFKKAMERYGSFDWDKAF
jgi:hypothetical protein